MDPKIILVDDDQNILASVSMALEASGFRVTSFTDGREALKEIPQQNPDLVVLDIKMPQMDGLEVLRNIRKTNDIPVIFLTSKDDEEDQIDGLRRGADDYITKPFSQKLLIERIRTLLRRQNLLQDDPGTPTQENITIGPLTLDDARHECRWNGEFVNLSVTEYLLVKVLAAHPGHVKNRDQLIDGAYGENIFVDDRKIDSHIKRIRKKFKQLDPGFEQIETVYGLGYKYKES